MELTTLVPSPKLDPALNQLSDSVKKGVVRFPDCVPKDCHRHSDVGVVSVWIKAISGSVVGSKADFTWQNVVLDRCPGLLDEDLNEWQPQIEVAALAVSLQAGDTGTPTVVTGDYRDRPDRLNLYEACTTLGLCAITTRDFLQRHRPPLI